MPVITRSQVKNLEKHVLSCKKHIHEGPVYAFKDELPRRRKNHRISYNGCIYEGEMKNGKMDGKGKMIYANGDIYEGTWECGLKCGKGKLIRSVDRQMSTGLWKKEHGVCLILFDKKTSGH